MGYLGKQPALQASEYREEFNITSTTTNIITSGFVRTGSSNYLEVYRNGVLLGKADYTLQSDYKTIVLTNAAVAGDIVVVLGRRNLTQGLKVAERRHEHVIQNGETTVTFPFPLTADITDVYINGVKLWYGDGSGDGSNSDYAINPVTRVISFGLNPSVGDTVSIVSREPTSVSSTPLPLIDSNGASVISENGGVISLSADTAMIEGSSSGDLVRITQTGSGNALVVEDSTNPDSTPFVVDASGFVGIGTSSPSAKLDIVHNNNNPLRLENTTGLAVKIQFADQNSNQGEIQSFSGDLVFSNGTGSVTERMRIDSSGALILVGSTAQKATGTTWSNPSDQRLKSNISDYPKGTAELMQVRVREWEYNGKGGTVAGTKGLGVIADEIMTVLPNTVDNYEAKLNVDDEETIQIKKFDATEITWLLVKTTQEQQTLIESQQSQIDVLTARIEALETT